MKRVQLIIVTGLAVLMTAGVSFAWKGYGKNGGGCPYTGDSARGAACVASYQAPSDEVKKQLIEACDAFAKETRELRAELFAKKAAMNAELVKAEPNKKTLKNLQGDISKIREQLDEKRLAHLLNLKSIDPDFTGVCARGMNRGMNRGCGGNGGMFRGRCGAGCIIN